MERIGADGILSVTPYYNKPTQEGLYQHYKAIAESTRAADRALQRARAHRRQPRDGDRRCGSPRSATSSAIKEASGNLVQMSEIVAAAPDEFLLLSGDDPMAVAVMAVGGRGVISVASNDVPAEMAQIIELCEKGDFAGARKLHLWLLPFLQVNFVESNPIPVQGGDGGDGADRRDAIACRWCRPAPAARDRIMSVLQELKLLGAAARVVVIRLRRVDASRL